MGLARTHPRIILWSEGEIILSENHKARGAITKVTLTSDEWFAAKISCLYGPTLYFEMSSK